MVYFSQANVTIQLNSFECWKLCISLDVDLPSWCRISVEFVTYVSDYSAQFRNDAFLRRWLSDWAWHSLARLWCEHATRSNVLFPSLSLSSLVVFPSTHRTSNCKLQQPKLTRNIRISKLKWPTGCLWHVVHITCALTATKTASLSPICWKREREREREASPAAGFVSLSLSSLFCYGSEHRDDIVISPQRTHKRCNIRRVTNLPGAETLCPCVLPNCYRPL